LFSAADIFRSTLFSAADIFRSTLFSAADIFRSTLFSAADRQTDCEKKPRAIVEIIGQLSLEQANRRPNSLKLHEQDEHSNK
jgi:hypothetical protein